MKRRAECVEKLRILAVQELRHRYTSETPQYRQTLKNLMIQVSYHQFLTYDCLFGVGYGQANGRRVGVDGEGG